ncbi:hypothetical protein T492DRAFT_407671 [Pavlovales sp. CCMP2436]|nr:hypothetical protein T492DRAFT_407671 [Pavlovales sp. CCMP2436]
MRGAAAKTGAAAAAAVEGAAQAGSAAVAAAPVAASAAAAKAAPLIKGAPSPSHAPSPSPVSRWRQHHPLPVANATAVPSPSPSPIPWRKPSPSPSPSQTRSPSPSPTRYAPSPSPARRAPTPSPRVSPSPSPSASHAPSSASRRHRHGSAPVLQADGKVAAPAGKPCVDAARQFERLSGGYTCLNAIDNCHPGQAHWRIVSSYCPKTCGKCVSAQNSTELELLGSQMQPEDPPMAYGGLGDSEDVRLDPANPTHVLASRYILTAVMPKVILEAYPQYMQIKALLAKHNIDGYVYHYRYEFGVCDHAMPRLCLRNLLVAAIGIFFTVLVFLPFRLALLSTVTVVMIDILLLGVMVLYNVRLHCMTTVTLLIALGLAIDYSCHLAHAYETSPLPTQMEKVRLNIYK